MRNILTILLVGILIFSACAQNKVQTQNAAADNSSAEKVSAVSTENEQSSKTECKICDFDFESYKGDLNKEEVNGLLLALNDEYMAWATYDQINKDFNDPRPFINIQKAEAKHFDRLKNLFSIYKIPVPENAWEGKTPKFESVVEACKAGVDAEIANRDLYTKLFKSTEREDILLVYKNLQRASDENHLPAFKRCSEGKGNGKGFGPGNGKGNGRGRGRN